MRRRDFLKGFMLTAAACGLSPISPMVASLESMPGYAPGVLVTRYSVPPSVGTFIFARQQPMFYKLIYGNGSGIYCEGMTFDGDIPRVAPDFGIRPEDLVSESAHIGRGIQSKQSRERIAAAVAMWDRLEAAGQI